MDYLLEMNGITKSFPGVKALNKVDLCVEPGTVHALMGENGAGKSTLMKVLFGMYRPDEGEIRINGESVSIRSTREALAYGISMIYQELSPIKDLSVAENIFVGRYPRKMKGIVDWRAMYEQCGRLLAQWGMRYDPRARMRSLKMADMQMIEIMKAVSFNAKLIIMDEPTSAITERETHQLFEFIRELKKRGVTVVLITHKLDEVFEIADVVTVLRDGQYIGTKPIGELTKDEMIRMMVGREISQMYAESESVPGGVLLRVENLNNGKKVQDISFELHAGEILGFAGIMGAGRTETMRCIFGIDHAKSGVISLEGRRLRIKNARDAISNRIMMATENRKDDGLVLCRPIVENITLPSLVHTCRFGILNKKAEQAAAGNIARQLRVKATSLRMMANSLSGGNQQKVILCKWLLMQPKVLILDEPTRGIDVGAKAEIYKIMRDLTKQGVGIILISSDMEEIIGMSDRVVVMCDGRINGVLREDEVTQIKIMALASEVSA